MASDWEEIKRLAADFQKIQLSSTLQKLSERNCIEIVTLLIEKGLIKVIFTNDGKEYLTPSHLETEIKDELYFRGGRVNLVELSKSFNIDLSHITNTAQKICEEDENIYLILGQLIDEAYLQRIATEINEKLSQSGELNVSELTVLYDLPSNFLLENVMEKYLVKIIHGKQDMKDSRIFFTQSHIARCKSKLRGALAALTVPTPVTAILSQSGVQERLFHLLLDDICTSGTVTSKLPGAQYIPNIYTKMQIEWVNTFYNQNGYLEYDSIVKLGISDVKGFVQRQLSSEKLTFLDNCVIGARITDQVESALEECIATGSYLDVTTILPSIISDSDVKKLLTKVIDVTSKKQVMVFETTILTIQYLDTILKPSYDLADTNAKKSVDEGKYQQYIVEKQISTTKRTDNDLEDDKIDRRDERRRKAASGRVGGGTQGRETKTKSMKKHTRNDLKNNDSDSDTEMSFNNKKKANITLELVTSKEIEKSFRTLLEADGLEYLAKELAQHYYSDICKHSLATAHSLYEASLQNSLQARRQTHAVLQEKLNNILVDIRLYEKGLKFLSSDVQPQLVKYLLKTLGTDVCNEISFYIANECNLNFNSAELTHDQRLKITQECANEYRSALASLNKSLNGSSIEDFLTAADAAIDSCSMVLKKIDKKKDRTLVLCHKHGLLEQLSNCEDPALILHLSVLVIFTVSTQNMLHASGRHVTAILNFLRPFLSDEQYAALSSYHDYVLKLLNNTSESEEGKEILADLNKMIPIIKEMASTYKKTATSSIE